MLSLGIYGNTKLKGNIMRKVTYHAEDLRELFRREKVLTMDAMKKALGTHVKMTVFRKLHTLCYRTSYSHAGKYYMLDEMADYDQHGLWSFGSIHFSRYGSLLRTIEALVCASEAGYFAYELQQILKVGVHGALLRLHSTGRLQRQKIAQGYLYMSLENWQLQLEHRKDAIEASVAAAQQDATDLDSPEIQKYLLRFLSTLNEKQRRLYVGFESMKLGWGGDTMMSRITGMNVKTIAQGRKELQSHNITCDRIRRAGGGRPPLEKKLKS